MKPRIANFLARPLHQTAKTGSLAFCALLIALSAVVTLKASTVTLYTNSFDSYSGAATNLADTSVTALPTGVGGIGVEDGVAQADAVGGLGWNGVQLINWAPASAHNSGNCMLLRPNTAFRCTFDPRGGTNYVWEFSMLSHRFIGVGGATRSYRISLRDQGADQNAHDFLIFRGTQSAITSGDDILQAFDGTPGKTWTTLTNHLGTGDVPVATDVWHHYKIVGNAVARTFDFYVDGVLTTTNYNLSRPQHLVVSDIRFANEVNGTGVTGGGPGAGDYTLIDNVSLTVDGNFIDLASGTFTEGFEGYTASTTAGDIANVNLDNDPGGPWVTSETAGTENGKAFLTNSVQVVKDSLTTGGTSAGETAGSQCLMVSQQQTSGSTISWDPAVNDDVRITWWAKVPAAPDTNADHVMLRVSLYAWEADDSAASDTILIGYGHRHTGANYGDVNGIITFSRWFSEWWANGQWGDTFKTFTPDTWEQYQLTTDVNHNSYELVKFPGSVYGTEVTIIEDGQYISSWGNNKKFHTIGFSTSNGGSTGSPHAAAYVDNVKVEPYTHTDAPVARPYSIVGTGPAARFTNYTVLDLSGRTPGGVAVNPLDTNTIVFTVDEEVNGSIMKATKVASGNWVIDPTPIVSGLYNPNGLTIDTNGTLWYVRDAVKGGQSCGLSRLAWPWTGAVEEVVTDFGSSPTNRWDQPCDLAFYNVGGVRTLAVLDRGVDASNNPNSIWTVDPATATLNQFNYNETGVNQLVAPDSTAFGFGIDGNANGIAWLAVSNELVTIWEGDGTTANGVIAGWDTTTGVNTRYIDTSASGITFGTGIDVDPMTGRIWVSDNVRQFANLSELAVPQIVSFDPADNTGAGFVQELSFPITTPTAGRPDRTIRMTDPGMRFSQDGKFLVVADKALHSGGGRLLIFHSEPFVVPSITITSVVRTGTSVDLAWTSGGAVNYEVQRSATVDGAYATVSPVLTGTQYTDTTSTTDEAFYKVLASPQN